MLWPLFAMFAAYICYFGAVFALRVRAELTERKIRNLRLAPGRAA
jgi:hypothetical protein